MGAKFGRIFMAGVMLIAAGLFLTACGEVEQETVATDVPPTRTPDEQYYDAITTIQPFPRDPLRIIKISEDICDPPCWMGIVPFVTTYEETLEIVESLVTFSSAGFIRINEDTKAIVWNPGGGNEVFIKFEGGYVSNIVFTVSRLTLEDVIQTYGVPDFYTTEEGDSEYGIELYFPQLGIVFDGFGIGQLSERTIMSCIFFVQPGTPDDFHADYIEIRMKVKPGLRYPDEEFYQWKGYGVCPEGLSSDYLCEE